MSRHTQRRYRDIDNKAHGSARTAETRWGKATNSAVNADSAYHEKKGVISIFCVHCGKQLQPGAAFCSGCGVKAENRPETLPDPPSNRPFQKKPLKGRIMDFVVILVASVLILMGIGSMALTVVGSTTTAQVTGYEQVLFVNNDDSTRNPSRYKLEYQFAVRGERYTGSVTRIFDGESHMRQTLPVRYLSFWPHVNAEDGETAGFVGPIMIGVGVVVFVFGVRKISRSRSKNR